MEVKGGQMQLSNLKEIKQIKVTSDSAARDSVFNLKQLKLQHLRMSVTCQNGHLSLRGVWRAYIQPELPRAQR